MSKTKTAPPEEEKATPATKAASSKKAPAKSAETETGLGELDKVRTILFGAQNREFERKFSHLENVLERELSALKETVERRFEALEAFVKKENESFSRRLSSEQQQRTDAETKLGQDIKDAVQALQATRTQLEERIVESERSLREHILNESKATARDMERGFDALSDRVEQDVADLRDDKADRHSLADLFEELSARLRNGLHLPTDEV